MGSSVKTRFQADADQVAHLGQKLSNPIGNLSRVDGLWIADVDEPALAVELPAGEVLVVVALPAAGHRQQQGDSDRFGQPDRNIPAHLFPSEMEALADRLEMVRDAALAKRARTQRGPTDNRLGETAGG
jgi:hypothetical protein